MVQRALAAIAPTPDELIVDVGAGAGALTIPLLDAGARVIAVERDHVMAGRVRDRVRHGRYGDRVRVIVCDFRRLRWPREPYRVVSNPPFAHTTELLDALFTDPASGPERAHLLVQHHVALNRTDLPASSMRSAAWAPWWTFERSDFVDRSAFSPPPSVDAMWMTVTKRDPPLLPTNLAPGFADTIRDAWSAVH